MIKSISCFLLLLFIILSACNSPKSEVLNRDPNGTSELQLTMREMFEYFETVKKQVEEGVNVEDIKEYKHILTDTPTEEGKNATDIYTTMADAYFYAVKQMNEEKDKAAFKLLVDGCMNCHRQVCPGPMVRIKKLYLTD